ncbi:MAG TPA: hypothetical protein VGE74_26250 [Gemmata sp.]
MLAPNRMTILVTALALPLVAGCSKQAFVEGSVTFNGRPVREGSISFEAPDGATPTFGGTIKDGAYRVEVPAGATGPRVVRVVASRQTGRKVPAGPPLPPGTVLDEIERAPPRYNDRSTLTADLRPGAVTRYDVEILSDPPVR